MKNNKFFKWENKKIIKEKILIKKFSKNQQ